MGLTKLQTMLLPPAEGYVVEEEPAAANGSPVPAQTPSKKPAAPVAANGSKPAAPPAWEAKPPATTTPALIPPATKQVEVQLPPPQVAPAPAPAPPAITPPAPARPPEKRSETLLAGAADEERADYCYRFNSDGSVRETVVYFYGDDLRAAQASGFDPLRREAVYQGRVDATRLFAARKLSDTLYVGDQGHERRDRRREYKPDGSVAQTIVFYYEGDRRAADAPSGAALRRQEAWTGEYV
jgi:hypothetical protein